LKGVILAAGEGKRIQSITYGGIPKELLPIGNVPTIRFPIEALKLAGVRNLFIVIAPQTKHGIVDGLQSGEKFGTKICYVVQDSSNHLRGMGPAILTVSDLIGENEDFVVACGDSIVCDFSSGNPLDCIKPLIHVHKVTNALATLLVYPRRDNFQRFGVIKFKELYERNGIFYGPVERMIEKPSLELAKEFFIDGFCFISTGYYVFKPRIFDYITKTKPGAKNEVQITDSMAMALENGEKICAVVHARNGGNSIMPCEYWDVGIPDDYKAANKRLLNEDLDKWIKAEERT